MITALALKAVLASAIALLIVTALRRSRASLRHLVLAALFAFLLLLPVVQRFAPRVAIEIDPKAPAMQRVVLPPELLVATEPGAVPAPPVQSRTALPIVPLYLSVSALLLGWLAFGVLRLRQLAEGGEVWLDGTARMNEIASAAGIRRAALVILSDDVAVPMTFGFRRSTILLPFAAQSWPDDELARALRHELEHVRREDWLLQLAARAAVAVYWLNPFAWMAWRRFCLEAERACDDAVVGFSAAPENYAGQLVSLARGVKRMSVVPALGMAGRSRLAERVTAILDPSLRRGPHGRAAAAATLVVVLALLVSLAPAQLVAAAAQRVATLEDSPYESPINEALITAAEAGDVNDVRRLLEMGVDVNLISQGNGTALIAAARGGQMHMVEYLLERGADVNLTVRGDGSPLIAAAREGYTEIVRVLLDSRADIDAIVPDDENALIQASAEGHEDVVRLLISRGADVNARAIANGNEIRTPLRVAERNQHVDVIRMLERAGARP